MKSEWKECTIGEIASVKGGKRLPKGKNLITEPNSHPYIRIRDLTEKRLEIKSSYEYVDAETQKTISRYVVDSGDILISIVGTIGLIAIVGESLQGANLTENCIKLIDLKDTVDSEYLYYCSPN
jgi:type I restriction enzyme S subunit